MRLAAVIGHESTARLLSRLFARDRLPHAVLFEGLPGCGRRTVALALAAAQLCEAPVAGDACTVCRSCRLVVAGNHPDLVGLPHDSEEDSSDPDVAEVAREQLKAEAVRELIEVRAWESPLIAPRRVFVLHAVERLQQARAVAANALLKALEEPPPHVRFVLTTASAATLLPTIRSRVQCYRLAALTDDQVAAILVRGGIPAADAALRAVAAGGSHRGLWNAPGPPPPIDELIALLDQPFASARIAELAARLPRGEGSANESRRICRRWLLATQQRQRRDLGGSHGLRAVEHCDRIQRALRDLSVNFPPRQVLEMLALSARG